MSSPTATDYNEQDMDKPIPDIEETVKEYPGRFELDEEVEKAEDVGDVEREDEADKNIEIGTDNISITTSMTAREFEQHDMAGLILVGRKDGDYLWGGTDWQWSRYFRLVGWAMSLALPDF